MESQLSFKAGSEIGGGTPSTAGEIGDQNSRIEGYVYLKRKMDWVRRYAIVQNCIFSYKKLKVDKEARKNIDLRRASIKYSAAQVTSADSYIKIDPIDQLLTIDLRFQMTAEFEEWLKCLKAQTQVSQASYSDNLENSDLRKTQILRSPQNIEIDTSKLKDMRAVTMPYQKRGLANNTIIKEQPLNLPPLSIKEPKRVPKNKYNVKNTYVKDQEIKDLKKRLDYNLNTIKWQSNKVKDSVQLFTDRINFQTSKSHPLREELQEMRATTNKDRMDIRQTVFLCIGLFIAFAMTMRGKDFVIGKFFPADPENEDAGYYVKQIVTGLTWVLQITLVSTLRGLYSKLGDSETSPSSAQKRLYSSVTDDLHLKLVTSINTTPYNFRQILSDVKLRQLWDFQSKIFKKSENGLLLTRNEIEIVVNFEIFASTSDDKTVLIEEFHQGKPLVLYELTRQEIGGGNLHKLTVYAKITGDIPTLKKITKELLKSNIALVQLSSQAQILSGQGKIDQENDNTSDDEDASEKFLFIQDKAQIHEEEKEEVMTSEQVKLKSLLSKLGEFSSRVEQLPDFSQVQEIYCIDNWPGMMHRYKPQYMPQIKKAIDSPNEFDRKWNLPEWKQVIYDKKVNLRVWQRAAPDGHPCIKATAIINRTAEQIFRVIGDDEYRGFYDPMYESGYFLERIADQTFLIYHKTKKVMIVGSRDFVLMMHYNKTPEGVIYAIAMESGCNYLVPETKGIVRAVLPMGGWRFEPLKDDPSKTRCDYIAEIDLKGHMPTMITGMAMKDQGYQIIELGKTVERFLKDQAQKNN